MKPANLIILGFTLIFVSCSGLSDYPRYEKYTPKYEGTYIISEKILPANYQLSKEFYADSIKSGFTTKYFGKDISSLTRLNFKPDQLQVIAVANDSSSQTTQGFTIYLVNTSKNAFNYYEVQDGSLIMIQQAKDEHGNWHPIESWCSSSCGNSYEDFLRLDPNTYIIAYGPRYKGDFQTELRFVFINYQRNKIQKIYSEPFRGSVNISQLEIPDDYIRGGFIELFEEKKEHHY